MSTSNPAEDKLFHQLEEAWRMFNELPEVHEQDLKEFRTAIRHAQHVVVLRTTRSALMRSVAMNHAHDLRPRD